MAIWSVIEVIHLMIRPIKLWKDNRIMATDRDFHGDGDGFADPSLKPSLMSV